MSHASNRNLLLKDIIVECSPDNAGNPALNGLALVILDIERGQFDLENISETNWKHGGAVEIPPLTDNVLIVAQSTTGGDIGHVVFMKDDWDNIRDNGPGGSCLKRDFETEDLKLSLSLRLRIVPSASDPASESTSATKDPTAAHASGLSLGDDPWKADQLNLLGDQFSETFETTNDDDDICRAIEAYKQAAACLSVDDPRLGPFLMDVCVAHMERYENFGDTNDLQEAITTGQTAIALLHVLGMSLLRRFERTGNWEDMSEAIKNLQHAIQLTPVGDDDLPGHHTDLGNLFLLRFERRGNLDDLSEAIKNHQRAVRLIPEGHPNSPGLLINLGNSFSRRFERSGNLNDISKAIENYQCAVQLTPVGHPNMPDWLANLGRSFLFRFHRSGDLGDISEAIEIQRRAVQLTRNGRANLPLILGTLGNSLSFRFDRTGDLEDISEAIENQRRAIQLTRDGDVNLPSWFGNLGNSFFRRFQRSGNMGDIDEAIKDQRHAVQLLPDGHPNLPSVLSDIGNSHLRRFEYSGDLDDLDEATKNQQRAVQLTPGGHPNFSHLLSSLGSLYSRRFERSWDLNDISEAIKHQQRAVQLTPDGHANLSYLLNNLGFSFLCRSEHNGDQDDISEAIKIYQRAVQLNPDRHPNLPGLLSSLGNAFLWRSKISEDPDDISEAIKNHQRAVELTPEGHSALPDRFASLGNSFLRRFEQNNDLEDISEAIKNQQRAVQLTPDGHLNLPAMLNNLGVSFVHRFEHTRNSDDISKAIENQQHAVQLTPTGHAYLPRWLCSLGNSFLRRFDYSEDSDVEYLAEALSTYRLAATSATGPPHIRLLAAEQWVSCSRKSLSSSSQILDAHACVIQLLSVVSGLENTIERRHQILVDYSDLSIAASGAALSLDRPDKALEWLVEGRCIVWSQINQLRTPLDKLRAHNLGHLADRLSTVSKELETAGSRSESRFSDLSGLSMDDKISLEEQAGKQIKLSTERDKLLATIRNIAGFEYFLQPRKCADIMRRLPDEGRVVVISTAEDRCDALALISGTSEPMHIPLPNFCYEKAEHLARGLRRYLVGYGVISRVGIPLEEDGLPPVDLAEVLRVLWADVVGPILEALGLLVTDSDFLESLPRLWWCPTGPLVFLPIHAAGIYVQGRGMPNECLSDFAVSSYIPTINSLLTTSESNSVKKNSDLATGMLVVSQPNTPGQNPIPCARVEAQKITKLLQGRGISSTTLNDQKGTVDSVLKAIESHPSIHLACHASQNMNNPLKSLIFLHDGQLDVSAIIKKNLACSNFAFLSACQTSTGDEKLPEEVVHIAAGMLAAGYRSVVGTMWSISDEHGPDIAEFFYEALLDARVNEGSKIDGSGAARALHRATQRFREISDLPALGNLLVWVPYIHIGI